MNINEAWESEGGSVHDFFDKPGEGFFVPLYQREYTWEEENINQLFDDLVLGLHELSGSGGDNAMTFLGTSIFTILSDKAQTVRDRENRGIPTAVRAVIDGQQRISTIALVAIKLRERLTLLGDQLPTGAPYDILNIHRGKLGTELEKLYSVKLGGSANPSLKPKIIHAKGDKWTFRGDDSSYGLPVARYIATYIRNDDTAIALNAISTPHSRRVRDNIELIDQWLDDVCEAHVPDTALYDQFPIGEAIATDRMQKHILDTTDKQLRKLVERAETDRNTGAKDYYVAAIYQLFLFSYYLLRRCGLNRINARRQEWGFDMFQSLNATGTPLTAMETFLPQVMEAEDIGATQWETTPSAQYMGDVDALFDEATNNQKKNQRTNELLRTFALCQDGYKLGNKFSAQRQWITRLYEGEMQSLHDKRIFLSNLAKVANFFRYAWYMEEVERPFYIRGLEKHCEGELASFLVQYLKNANSKLSAPILARFYSQATADSAYVSDLIEASKACAAFFTLWRSARSTSGLDDIYRRFFKGSDKPVQVSKHSWTHHPSQLSAMDLKRYFVDVLKEKGLDQKDAWLYASKKFLVYTGLKTVCRFVLFLGGHDQVKDSNNPGLTTVGNKGVCPLLGLDQWRAKDYKTLEHVAPKKPPPQHKWDKNIYSGDAVDEIGNLLLLPTDINGDYIQKSRNASINDGSWAF